MSIDGPVSAGTCRRTSGPVCAGIDEPLSNTGGQVIDGTCAPIRAGTPGTLGITGGPVSAITREPDTVFAGGPVYSAGTRKKNLVLVLDQ